MRHARRLVSDIAIVIALIVGIAICTVALTSAARWATWAATGLMFPFADPDATVLNAVALPVGVILIAALVATRGRPFPMNRALIAIVAFVPLLIVGIWGMHIFNGAFIRTPASELAYVVAALRSGKGSTTADLQPVRRDVGGPLSVDADVFAHPLHRGDTVHVQVASGRLGYAFVRAYR